MDTIEQSTTAPRPTLLEGFLASVVATILTAIFVYPWVSLWFDPPRARPWAWYFLPINLIAMTFVAPYTAHCMRRVWFWFFMPLVSYILGASFLFVAWHSFYSWQRLPALSLASLMDKVPHWAFVGVFLGMWFPGLWWTLSFRGWVWLRSYIRRRKKNGRSGL